MRAIAHMILALVVVVGPISEAGAGERRKFNRSVDRVDGSYIVVLKRVQLPQQTPQEAHEHVIAARGNLIAHFGGRSQTLWHRALWGFSAEMTELQAIALAEDPLVEYVEENSAIYLSQDTDFSLRNLDRIDESSTQYDYTYSYDCPGTAVPVYIVDTGVMQNHTEFIIPGTQTSRVKTGADFAPYDGYSQVNPGVPNEDNYTASHGTSVASVAAGLVFGVAKSAKIIPVRVINSVGEGTVEDLLDGLDWVADDYAENQSKAGVVNMSIFRRLANPLLGWTVNGSPQEGDAIEDAVDGLVADGLTVVVSANNQNTDACYTTPAAVTSAVTVAGSIITWFDYGYLVDSYWVTGNPTYTEWTNPDPGSNWGPCVDIIAPASDIRSAHTRTASSERSAYKSGTSFAAPHVTGAVARYLQAGNKGSYWPAQVAAWLDGNASQNVVINVPSGTVNKLLFAPYPCRWDE